MSDNQFDPVAGNSGEHKIYFQSATAAQRFNLFGTKQKIGGIESDNQYGTIQYGENNPTAAGLTVPAIIANVWESRRDTPSILELNGAGNYNYMGSPYLCGEDSKLGLTVNKTGTGTQVVETIKNTTNKKVVFNVSNGALICQNPDTNTANVTFNSLPGGTIEFRGTGGSRDAPSKRFFGAGCIFTGAGAFKQTGDFNIINLQPDAFTDPGNQVSITGSLTIEGGTLQNVWDNVNWTASEADVTLNSGTFFDIWGNVTPVKFDQLSGLGTIQSNWGSTHSSFMSELWIGVKDGSSTFDGIILNNTVNNNQTGGEPHGGGINLTKWGTGRQIFTGANTYSGTTLISAGLLGGPGSVANSAVTVDSGGGIFGGTGTGHNGVFTTGNLTFAVTSSAPSHVLVYVNNYATSVANALSLIQVGGDPGSRLGTGTLTAAADAIINIDFMDALTVAEGTYTIISSADASSLAGNFQLGINNSGCCLTILKNTFGIQVTVKRITFASPLLSSLCAGVATSLSVVPAGTYTWTQMAANTVAALGTSTTETNTITGLSPGLSTTVTASNGACGVSATLTINGAVLAKNTDAAFTLCTNTNYADALTILRSGTSTADGEGWKVYDAGTTTVNTVGTTVAEGTSGKGSIHAGHVISQTMEEVVYKVAGCTSNKITFTINPGVLISLPANGSSRLCHAGARLQLTAPAGAAYRWSSDNEAAATVDAQGWVTSVAFGRSHITAISEVTGCSGSRQVEVDDPQVKTVTGFDASKLCANQDYLILTLTNGDAQGMWRVYDAAGATSITKTNTSVTWASSGDDLKKGSIHAGNISGTITQYVTFTQHTCESSRLPITIAAPPVPGAVKDISLCSGTSLGSLVLPFSGIANDQVANGFKFSGGADVGLTDNITQSLSSFTAVNTTAAAITRAVTVWPVNTNSNCVGISKTFHLTVNPLPAAVTLHTLTPMCSGTATSFGLKSDTPNLFYTCTVAANEVGATKEEVRKNDIKQTLINGSLNDATVAYTITPQTSFGCAGASVVSHVVVRKTAVVSAVSGKEFCLQPAAAKSGNSKQGGTYTTDIRLTTTPADALILYTPVHSANVIVQKYSGPPHTQAIRDELTSTGSGLETVTYSITPYAHNCAGKASVVSFVLKPVPEFTGDENSVPDITLCEGTAHADIEVKAAAAGLTKPTGFTWIAAGNSEETGLADYTDIARPREKIGPFTAVNATTNKHRSITLTPYNSTTGCAGPAQVVEVFLKVRPVITNVNPEICVTNINPLLLTTANPAGAGTNPLTPSWAVLSGGEFASIAARKGDAAVGDFTPIKKEQTDTKTVEVQYTDANGCKTTTHVSVNYTPVLTFTSAAYPVICAGNVQADAAVTNIGFTSSQPHTKYTWSAVKGTERAKGSYVSVNESALPIASSPSEKTSLAEKIMAEPGSDTDIIFSVTPLTGSCSGTAGTIAVKVIGKGFGFTVSPPTDVICAGSAANIIVGAANDGISYTWTVDDHNGSVIGAAAQTTGVSGGALIKAVLSLPSGRPVKKAGLLTYNIAGTREGCQGSPTAVSVEVDPYPVIGGVASGNICSNSATGIKLATDIIAAEAGRVKYSWAVNENSVGATASTAPQSAFTEPTLINSRADGTDAAVSYTFTAIYGVCAGPATNIVRTVTAPIATNTISGGGKACLGDLVTLTSNAKGRNLTYQWRKGTTLIDGAVAQSYVVPSVVESNDNYNVAVSNACQNNAAAEQAVLVEVKAEAYFEGATATAIPAAGATLGSGLVKFTYTQPAEGDATHTVYAWNFGDGSPIVAEQNPSHLYAAGSTAPVAPTLTVKKAGQEVCTKKWDLSLNMNVVFPPATGDLRYSSGLQIFPVPACDQVTISGDSEMSQIIIRDLNGKQVWSAAVSGNKVSVPVSGLSSGLYILTAETGLGVKHVKIIKE